MEMPEGADITLGEISRNVVELRKDFRTLGEGLDKRPDWDDITRIEHGIKARHDRDINHHETAIRELQDSNKWLMRLTVSSLGGVVLSLLITASQLPQIQ